MFFFFNDTATTEIYTLSLHDALPISHLRLQRRAVQSKPPRLALLDLRTSAVRSGLATPAVLAIERHLAAHGQGLGFLHPRGYAPPPLCTACGRVAPRRECDARPPPHLAPGPPRRPHC